MSYDRQVSRALDDEHRANIALFERVVRALAKPSPDTAELAQLAVALCRQIEQDVGRHFDFEERELFPRMTDAGDGEMAALLAAEHAAIPETATALLPLAYVPAVHAFLRSGQDVDARDKPGHDEEFVSGLTEIA